MFIKTKLTKTLATLSICGVSSLAFAGGPDMPHHDLYSGGIGLGLEYVEALRGDGSFGVTASYTTDELTAQLGMSASHTSNPAGLSFMPNSWQLGFDGEAGFRDRMGMTNTFLKYGAGFGVAFLTNKVSGQQNPWFIGPFAGLDYQPCHNFMISGSLYPVSYGRDTVKQKVWNFFSVGKVSLNYIF